jgi:hypothetical protein
MPACPHIFALNVNYPGTAMVGGLEMADVVDLPATVSDFREEAQQCLLLAKGEPEGELRTVLAGMALGWLKLADYTRASQALEIEHAEA